MSLAWRAVGARALLVEVEDAVTAVALASAARAARVDAEEVVAGAVTVLFDGVADPIALVDALEGLPTTPVAADRRVDLPVVWDGADLDWVAQRWGTDVAGAIGHLEALELVAAFGGFAPGFAYLAGLPPDLQVPRLASPRPRVPAGSVALAGEWCGVYPTASPGGWRIVGRTSAALWDADRVEPALIAPGARVRFVGA